MCAKGFPRGNVSFQLFWFCSPKVLEWQGNTVFKCCLKVQLSKFVAALKIPSHPTLVFLSGKKHQDENRRKTTSGRERASERRMCLYNSDVYVANNFKYEPHIFIHIWEEHAPLVIFNYLKMVMFMWKILMPHQKQHVLVGLQVSNTCGGVKFMLIVIFYPNIIWNMKELPSRHEMVLIM